jgi:serine protease AprX
MNHTAATIKADAARIAFGANGQGITWAVMDSGIDATHPHFATHNTLQLSEPLTHKDFTGTGDPLTDEFGHGTHVAGIIAGEGVGANQPLIYFDRERDELGNLRYVRNDLERMIGIAPQCRLVSYKVLDARGRGDSSRLLAALAHVNEVNAYGRRLQIHGVNLSVGYDFDPEWFACGQSPLCVEVNRLVRSGVVVVIAAGNTGYTKIDQRISSLYASINDPGNAQLAITVGSTHRDMPHLYGVSYFSSKGPTGDGRVKPDLVAPGEKILSCAAGSKRNQISVKTQIPPHYLFESGTSMATPHVSAAIAAFLSVRREFIGRPDEIKQIFTSNATDLGRHAGFQGSGLLDIMRAIQAV